MLGLLRVRLDNPEPTEVRTSLRHVFLQMPGELEPSHIIQRDVYIVLDHRSEQLIAYPAPLMNERTDVVNISTCKSLVVSLPMMLLHSLTGHSHSRPKLLLLHSVFEQLEQLRFLSGQGDSRDR